MTNTKPLTNSEKAKIAQILDHTDAGSMDYVSLMIEMHTLGVIAKETDNEYTYWWEYVEPQLQRALLGERVDKTNYHLYSVWLEKKINQFAEEVIRPWFIKTFKFVSNYLVENDLTWDMNYISNFYGFCCGLNDTMTDVLDGDKAPDWLFFGVEVFDEEEE